MSLPPDAEGFEEAYEGSPPWDIGRPQGAIVRAAEAGLLRGSVLDVGCGTGENALFLAQAGHYVWGVDVVESAIETAREKARERGLDARFFVLDALDLDHLDRQFDTVVDSGLFHVFDGEARERYVEQLAGVLRPGGRVLVLCFSDLEPGDWGPNRVAERELQAAFAKGWTIQAIEPTRFEVDQEPGYANAWLALVRRGAPV